MIDDRIPFSNLKSTKGNIFKLVAINDKQIKVKQYLPVNEKLTLITNILQQTGNNEYNFINPFQLDVYTTLAIVYNYSNIEFTEEDKANPDQLYDALEQADIINAIIAEIPKSEYEFVVSGIEKTVSAYYEYQNSALGILENFSKDYSNLNLEAEDIEKEI